MKVTRLDPETRKQQILTAAVGLAEKEGYRNITRRQIALAAGTSPPLVSQYFGSMGNMRSEIMREALRVNSLHIIAQGLLFGCPIAMTVSLSVRDDALRRI